MSDEEQEPSRRYWKAAISTLPAEKRDAAWEFYIAKFAGTNAGDTLSGLILLLEANGVFLLTLPEKFHAELIQPITDSLDTMRKELQETEERQKTALQIADTLNEVIEKARAQFAETTDLFAWKVRAAAQLIDTGKISGEIYVSLRDSVAIPLRNELKLLPEQSRQISQACKAAESSIEKWHKIHFAGILANCIGIAAIVAVVLAGFAYRQCKRHFDQRLSAEIMRMDSNYGAISELLGFGIDILNLAWRDANDKPVHDGYILTLSNAVDARIKKTGDTTEVNILVKQETPQEQMERTEQDREEAISKKPKKTDRNH